MLNRRKKLYKNFNNWKLKKINKIFLITSKKQNNILLIKKINLYSLNKI